jgi:O-antigen/teichoic acid export membrane protein
MAVSEDEARETSGPRPGRSQRAIRGYLWSMTGRGARNLSRVLAFLCVARLFSLTETGLFAFIMAIGNFTAVASDLGLSEQLMRDLPGRRHRGLEEGAFALRLASLPLGIVIAWAVLWTINPSNRWGAAGTLTFAAAVGASDFLAAWRRAHGRFDLEALESSLPAFAALAAAAAWGARGGEFASFQVVLGGVALVVVLARFASGLTALRLPTHLAVATEYVRSAVRASRWFFVKAVVVWGTIEVAVVALKLLASDQDVALYAAALRIAGLMTFPYVVLGSVFTPALAHELARGKDLGDATRRLNLLGLLLGHASFAACMVSAEVLLRIFGRAYVESLPVLQILALGFFVLIAAPSAVPLVVTGREKAVSLVGLATALLLVATAWWWVPRHGAIGAATASLTAYCAAKLTHLLLYRRAGLPLISGSYLIAATAVAIWLGLYLAVAGPWRLTLLIAGLAVSGTLVLRMIWHTTIFTTDDEPAEVIL